MESDKPVRLLIVDDSSAYRKILKAVISRDPSIEVVGLAENGKVCLEKLAELKPDVVTLDIEMPEMNGLETLQAIRQKYPSLPVIMLSSLTDQGATETVKSLGLGAQDFVHKVLDTDSVEKNIEYINTCIVPKIKLQHKHKRFYENVTESALATDSGEVASLAQVPKDVNLIVMGVGTGGYQSLLRVITKIEKNAKIPILVTCYMNGSYLETLAQELKKSVKMPIKIVEDAFPLFPRFMYLASAEQLARIVQGDSKLTIEVDRTTSSLDMERNEPINHLFHSVLKLPDTKAMAILLKFSGGDGMEGMQALRANGHFTVIQDSEMLGAGESAHANIRVPIQQMHTIINTLK